MDIFYILYNTVDREIFVVKKFLSTTFPGENYTREILCMTNVFNVKHFMATKIRLHENFTSEIFYWQKYPDLQYVTFNQSVYIIMTTIYCIGNILFFLTKAEKKRTLPFHRLQIQLRNVLTILVILLSY